MATSIRHLNPRLIARVSYDPAALMLAAAAELAAHWNPDDCYDHGLTDLREDLANVSAVLDVLAPVLRAGHEGETEEDSQPDGGLFLATVDFAERGELPAKGGNDLQSASYDLARAVRHLADVLSR
jgi:hypothetical protein